MDHLLSLQSSRDIAEFSLTPKEWQVVDDLYSVLEVRSSTLIPTP